MNRLLKIINPLLSLLAVFCMLILTSCERNHFANPLPIDSKNLYQIPSAFRGQLFDYNDSSEIYLLGKNSITFPAEEGIKIINGIWFHPRDTMSLADTVAWKKINKLPEYESRYTLKYDSTKKIANKIENYILKGNKIYNIQSNSVGRGTSYIIKDDTIFTIPEPRKIVLGPDAFFRKVTDDFYMVNIRDSELEIGNINWWQIRLLEKRKDGKIILYDWSDKIEEDSSLIHSSDSHNYFDSQWTRKDILRLLSEGKLEAINLKR